MPNKNYFFDFAEYYLIKKINHSDSLTGLSSNIILQNKIKKSKLDQ